MYLVHSDRLLTRYDCSTRSTRGSSIYIFCTKYLSSLNILLLFEVVIFEHMFYLHKLFDIRKLFEYPLIYTKCSNIASCLKHRVACYQLAAAQYTDSVQIICPAWIFFYCLKLFDLNICSIYANYSISASDSIYTIYQNLTSTTPHTKNSRQLNIQILYRLSVQLEYFFYCLKLFYLYEHFESLNIYTNYSSFTSATQYCNYAER